MPKTCRGRLTELTEDNSASSWFLLHSSRNGFTVLLVTYLSIQEDCKQHLLVEPFPSSSKVLNLYTGTEDPNSLWKIQTFCKNVYSKQHFKERETVAEVTFTEKANST